MTIIFPAVVASWYLLIVTTSPWGELVPALPPNPADSFPLALYKSPPAPPRIPPPPPPPPPPSEYGLPEVERPCPPLVVSV